MKNFFKDMLEQAWTLLGLATGWLVLEGTAKDVVGKLILITIAVWMITYPLRRDKDK